MRNKSSETISEKIIKSVNNLPYFSIKNLKIIDNIDEKYLRINLSRLSKKNYLIKLKRGIYVSKNFINNIKTKNLLSPYLEFISEKIYEPSYLSLDYVLSENEILTEMPKNFTLISANKTKILTNSFGNFIYHKIKNKLFIGFKTEKIDNFFISKATKAKALFDFLYLRKNLIIDKSYIKELRLNLESFNKKDKLELNKYIKLEGSKKMETIYKLLCLKK
ncbi:hypothetical protein KKG58_04625 [Patescibacteria group bacterium]|nr:hypothetical protein [Patescibacteria group bacterium]